MLKYRYKKAWSSILALLFFFYSVLLLNFIFDKQSIVHAHNALGRTKNIILVGDNLEDSPAKKYKMALDAIGLDCEIISVDNFSKDNLDNINFLIIPHDISHSIKKKMLKEIIIEVYSGMLSLCR